MKKQIQKRFDEVFGPDQYMVVDDWANKSSHDEGTLFGVYTQQEANSPDFLRYDPEYMLWEYWEYGGAFGYSYTVRDESVGASDYAESDIFETLEQAANALIMHIAESTWE